MIACGGLRRLESICAMALSDDSLRSFFALWPDTELRSRIAGAGEQLLDANQAPAATTSSAVKHGKKRAWRAVPQHNLHLTLLFLGNQSRSSVEELCSRVNELRAKRFELALDHFGWFPRPKVAWLGANAPRAGMDLVQQLSRISSACGMRYQQRGWRPHMTLFRRVSQQPEWPHVPAIRWAVHEFVLLQSMASQPYQVLKRWPLYD